MFYHSYTVVHESQMSISTEAYTYWDDSKLLFMSHMNMRPFNCGLRCQIKTAFSSQSNDTNVSPHQAYESISLAVRPFRVLAPDRIGFLCLD